MSKLSYKIQQSIDEMDGKSATGLAKLSQIVVYFVKDLWYDYPHVWLSHALYMYKNVKFFWPHIRDMRDWDSFYQINLFCDGLEYLAQGLKQHDHCVNSDRHYKRCLFAAKRLRAAYDDRAHEDKSYKRLSDKNPIKFVKCANGRGSIMTHDYHNTEEYYEKMFKLIHKRTEATMAAEKAASWAYINKHIQSWWD